MTIDDDLLDGLIDAYGYVPVWTQDDVKNVLKVAMKAASSESRAQTLVEHAEALKSIRHTITGQNAGGLLNIVDHLARDWTMEAHLLRQTSTRQKGNPS